MAKKKKQVFKKDRRKQLRLRLATKRAGGQGQTSSIAMPYYEFPERELLDRIIERVRRL